MLVLRHLSVRKRNLKKEPETVRSVVKLAWIDILIYFVSVVGPLATVPQVLQIYATHNASGLALPSWITYGFLNLIWIYYGYKHREKPIIITNIALVILNCIVVAGIILYS